MGTSRGRYKLQLLVCLPHVGREWTTEVAVLNEVLCAHQNHWGFFCWLVLISDRFSCDSADGPRLVLYLGVIRITWRAFQHTWGPLPWGHFGMERSGCGHTCAQSSLDPSSLLLGVRESTLNWSSVQTVTISIVLRFFITPFHLLILVSNCTLLVYRNTTDFWVLTFYPMTLPNSCIISRSSSEDFLGFVSIVVANPLI